MAFDLDPASLVVVTLVLGFTFLNGYADAASLVATAVYSGALAPRRALLLAAAGDLIGPLVGGTAVATTLGTRLVVPDVLSLPVLAAGVTGAIGWGLVALALGRPTSATHALVGAFAGAALVAGGPAALQIGGLGRVLLTLAVAPTLGLVGGYILMHLILWTASSADLGINTFFRRAQPVTSFAVALAHGANDAQKGMAVIALAAATQHGSFHVTFPIALVVAIALAAGAAIGGRRLLHTLGGRIYRVRPIHGFAAQTCTGLTLWILTVTGGPASTSQVAVGAIFGVGAAERLSMVRWQTGWAIAFAWLVTLPITAGLGGLSFVLWSLVL